MSFWDSNDQTADNLARLGPIADGVVGTDGKYADLYEAVITAGWHRILLAPGAYLSQDLTITTNYGFIVGNQHGRIISLGAHNIFLNANYWRLEGFQLYNGSGVGITNTGNENYFAHISVNSYVRGFVFSPTGDDNQMFACTVDSCSSDGVLCQSGANRTRILGSTIINNGGWGVDDTGSDDALIIGNRIAGNSSGQVNPGTSTIHTGLNILT
jgi:hypothetical protein